MKRTLPLQFATILLPILLLLSIQATAKDHGVPHNSGGSSGGSLNMDLSKLPPGYKGDDIVKAYSLFSRKAPIVKNEYQTTGEYQNAIESAISILSSHVYGFRLDPRLWYSTDGGVWIKKYDADTQSLSIEVHTEFLSDRDRVPNRGIIILKEVRKSSSSYVGVNAFGGQRLVRKHESLQYGVAVTNLEDFDSGTRDSNESPLFYQRTVKLVVRMSPDRAKAVKGALGVLLLCRPAAYPWKGEIYEKGNSLVFESHFLHDPTLEVPTHLSYDRRLINFQVLSLWVYDMRTGQVLLKERVEQSTKMDEQTKETSP